MSTCLACGKPKHWPARCGDVKLTAPKKEAPVKLTADPVKLTGCDECERLRERIMELEAQLGVKRVYMREYMKRRRGK